MNNIITQLHAQLAVLFPDRETSLAIRCDTYGVTYSVVEGNIRLGFRSVGEVTGSSETCLDNAQTYARALYGTTKRQHDPAISQHPSGGSQDNSDPQPYHNHTDYAN